MKNHAFILHYVILIAAAFFLTTSCEKEELPVLENEALQVESRGGDTTLTAILSYRAWVWADQPTTASYTPHLSYQYSSLHGRGEITITRESRGAYLVQVPNAGGFYEGLGHALAYGGSHTAQIGNWTRLGSENKLLIRVFVFGASGVPIDGRFVLFFYKEENRVSAYNSAYQWSNSSIYSFNSKGGANTIVRGAQPGEYTVTFDRITPNVYDSEKRGTVLVTPYGNQARRATVKSWSLSGGRLRAYIQVRDARGIPADGLFTVSYISDFRIGQRYVGEETDYGAYLCANQPSTANYTPDLFYQQSNASARPSTVQRLGVGYYKVTLPSIKSFDTTMAMASAYGVNKTYVSIDGWFRNAEGGTDIYVRGFDYNGLPADTRFTLFYYTDENILF